MYFVALVKCNVIILADKSQSTLSGLQSFSELYNFLRNRLFSKNIIIHSYNYTEFLVQNVSQ